MSKPILSEPNLEQLRQKFEGLQRRKIQIETQLAAEEQQLERLKQEARENFGTDDLTQLTRLLTEMEQANAQKLKEYGDGLRTIESELQRIELSVELDK